MTRAGAGWLAAAGALLAGCSGSGGSTADPCNPGFTGSADAAFSATGTLTAIPVALSGIQSVSPLGTLNPPANTYPADHIFIVLQNAAADANAVYAPGPGKVIYAAQPAGTDYRVIVQVDVSFYYSLNHLHLASGVSVGGTLVAGQQIGTNSGLTPSVELGVLNFNNAPLAGILDSCLAESDAYVDSPLSYFSGAILASLEALVTVTSPQTKQGGISYDVKDRLAGDWVLAGQQEVTSAAYQLAFSYNVTSLAQRISVGGTLAGGAATYGIQSGALPFVSVTPGTGQINYQLFPTTSGDTSAPGAQYGVLSVNMLSGSQIQVEIFPGATTSGTFDSAAQTYDR